MTKKNNFNIRDFFKKKNSFSLKTFNLVSKLCLNSKENENNEIKNTSHTLKRFNLSLKLTRGFKIEIGRVMAIKDSVIVIDGMPSAKMFECIHFVSGDEGLILNLEKKSIKALCFQAFINFKVNDPVYNTGSVMSVRVGLDLVGRVLNPLGISLEKSNTLRKDRNTTEFWPVERKAPGVITRFKIKRAVYTGVKIVDSLVPIGRGQRELILGDRKSGKTTIAIDTILNQKTNKKLNKDSVFCIYCTIGKRLSEVKRIFKLFSAKGCLSYVILVVTSASDSAALQYIAPYSATSIAEFFTYRGLDSLIIYDDLTKHADVYRQISLLLRRPVGREAFPGDVFYCHSKLLERSVSMNANFGAGSLTSLPIVETIQNDVSAYIPTNIISITDGQIFLDLGRHQEGLRPAVDPGISVSRIGSSVQCKSMKKCSGSLKLELAQYRELESFAKFSDDMDDVAKKRLVKGRLLVEILLQKKNKPLEMYKQIMMLYAASAGFLNNVKTAYFIDSITSFEELLMNFLERSLLFKPFYYFIENIWMSDILDIILIIFKKYKINKLKKDNS